VVLTLQTAKSQHFTHDVGFHAGTATIQADFGVRDNFLSSYGNSAISISLTHTLHFFNKDPRWNSDHKLWSYLALRSEFNIITNANFQHYGPFVQSGNQVEKFRAMSGTTNITNIGFQLEYYMRCLKDFIYPWSHIKWNPYVLAGVQYTMYRNTLSSTLGDWEQDISVLPNKWTVPGALDVGKGTTYAVTFGGGVRYKFSSKLDFNAQFNWQFFLSDAVDGLQADVIENKNNEWLLNFQLGIIYHLNFDRPLTLFKK
tara:strand:+ start:35469 stop:36239 length:771 start_codon:yes stop_codon:yes gene_type:complete